MFLSKTCRVPTAYHEPTLYAFLAFLPAYETNNLRVISDAEGFKSPSPHHIFQQVAEIGYPARVAETVFRPYSARERCPPLGNFRGRSGPFGYPRLKLKHAANKKRPLAGVQIPRSQRPRFVTGDVPAPLSPCEQFSMTSCVSGAVSSTRYPLDGRFP